ncbi:MAG: TVP38/TMEM64 family protein [Geminicoccales bacterium]
MNNLSVARLCLIAMIGLASIGIASMAWLGFNDRLGIDLLREHQYDLLSFVTSKPVLAGLLFTAIYALVVAASVPGLALLTMVGGYLFGWVLGATYTMIAATIASACVFLLAKSAFGAAMRERAGPMIQRFARGFKESALSYVFIMHLIPIFPYMVVTTLPAACGVPLPIYMFSAFFGILPATVLLARVGAGLGDVIAQEGPIEIANFMTTDIMLSLGGLAVLALLPVFYRALKPGVARLAK